MVELGWQCQGGKVTEAGRRSREAELRLVEQGLTELGLAERRSQGNRVVQLVRQRWIRGNGSAANDPQQQICRNRSAATDPRIGGGGDG